LEISVNAKSINNTTLEFVFTNFNNPIGLFIKELAKVGTIRNRNLYFGYFISAFPDTKLKRFHYTFYLGEVVTNG
jgi:hypothetical protein